MAPDHPYLGAQPDASCRCMSGLRLPLDWGAVGVGIVSTTASMVLLWVLGLALGSALDLETRFDRTRMAVLWAVPGAIVAFALGGWTATKVAVDRVRGPMYGLLVSAATLLLVLLLVGPVLQHLADLRSVGIALGLVDAPDVGTRVSVALDRLIDAAGERDAPFEGTVVAAAYAHTRATAWYACVVLAALFGAAALGGATVANRTGRFGRDLHATLVGGIGLVSTMALTAGLTAWLWTSLSAVGTAVFDTDQSAGPEIGVNLTEVAQHPEVMWAETVTVSARVDRVFSPHTMLIGNDNPVVGNKVLVVSEAALERLVPLAGPRGAIHEGDVVQVTGIVRPFDVGALEATLRVDLDEAALAGYEGRAVLVARAIDLDVPVAAEAGDKEFVAGSAGYDVGVTTDDVVYHPEQYLGQTVTVSDEVEEHLLTPHAFLLGDRALLAVSAAPHPELFIEATAYVMGEVRIFDLKAIEVELGIDLEDGRFRGFAGDPVIVVDRVVLVT